MALSFTIHYKKLNLPSIKGFDNSIKLLFERADKKNNGYITITLTLPRRNGTDAQNRTFHALLTEFYISNRHSYACYEDMRDDFKLKAAGAKEYIYMTLEKGIYRQHTVKILDDVPENCVWARVPKSWKDFTSDERASAIQLVITEGFNQGIDSDKWFEIINGFKED